MLEEKLITLHELEEEFEKMTPKEFEEAQAWLLEGMKCLLIEFCFLKKTIEKTDENIQKVSIYEMILKSLVSFRNDLVIEVGSKMLMKRQKQTGSYERN